MRKEIIAQLKCIRWRIVAIALFIILWIQGPARLNGMTLQLTQEVPCKSSEKDSSREDCIPSEITFEAQRAGSERYRYVPGLGYPIRSRLGLAGSFEFFSELKKIEDLAIVTGLEFPSVNDRRDENIRPFLEPVQTSSALIQATIRIFSKTRFRYTALIKDFDLTFKEEDHFRWRSHNFDISKGLGFSLREDRCALVINPIFERRTITKKNDQTDEIENVFLLQFRFKRCKGGELNVQLSRSKVDAQDTDAETNNRFSRVELRFPVLQSLLTAGWFHGRAEFLPGSDILAKDEIYLDSGIDSVFSSHLRDGLRLTWARIVDKRKSLEDLTARSLVFENKISYNVLPDSSRSTWDVSALQFYGKDFKEPSRYDFWGFGVETELYLQTGWLSGTRATLSFAIYHYRHLEQTERIFTLRLHPFRF